VRGVLRFLMGDCGVKLVHLNSNTNPNIPPQPYIFNMTPALQLARHQQQKDQLAAFRSATLSRLEASCVKYDEVDAKQESLSRRQVWGGGRGGREVWVVCEELCMCVCSVSREGRR